MAKSKIATFASKRPPYFWWILAHALAVCLCALSWILSLQIFNHPERPQNYTILKKLGRAPEPIEFCALEAPAGDSLLPNAIYKNYAAYAAPENAKKLTKLNVRLLRAYLQNYTEELKPVYIEGDYRVLQVKPLQNTDLMYPGFAIRAQAFIQSDNLGNAGPYPVIIEYICPCENMASFTWAKPGNSLRVQKIPHCASILNVSLLGTSDEPIINLTVVSLTYNDVVIGESRQVDLAAPKKINLAGRLPLFPNSITEQ